MSFRASMDTVKAVPKVAVFSIACCGRWSSSTRWGVRGETDQPTGMSGHEINGLRRHVLSGNDEIAFILAIFVIDEDDEFPLLDVPNCLFDAMKGRSH